MKFFLSKGLYGDRKRSLGHGHMEPGHLFVWVNSFTLEVDYDHLAAERWGQRLSPGGRGFWAAAMASAGAGLTIPEIGVLLPMAALWAAYLVTVVKLK